MFHVPEKYRVKDGPLASNSSYGNNGAFLFPPNKFPARKLSCIASDGEGWEHVSVKSYSIPTWEEMCYIKNIFWDPEDLVMQLHPRKSQYINVHPRVLHLWRPLEQDIPEPPSFLV